jgi:hypothetical protein
MQTVAMPNRRPQLELPIADRRDRRLASTNASPQEAAAIVAALERFMHDTAPPLAPQAGASLGNPNHDLWRRAALREGANHEPEGLASWAENT